MNLAVQEMKNKLIMQILDFEKMQVGRAKRKCIQYNAPEYYHVFEAFYVNNERNFIQALLDLRNLSDESYKTFVAKIAQISYYCSLRILVHILRLSLYFNVRTTEIPAELKALFVQSIVLQCDKDYSIAHQGFLAFHSCCALFDSVANPSTGKPQLYYHERPVLDFTDFILLHEVTNKPFAVLYEKCYRYKNVKQCPVYIKDALKAANLYDHLVGPLAWDLYLSKRSTQSIYKDISLLRKVGFDRIPCLLEELVSSVEEATFQTKEKKCSFVKRMLRKNQKRIEGSMQAESGTVDTFLRSKIV